MAAAREKPEDVQETPGSRTLAKIVGALHERMDEWRDEQVQQRATIEHVAEDVTEIKVGMNGLIPRVENLERYNIRQDAAVGTIDMRAEAMRKVGGLVAASREQTADREDTRQRARGILWAVLKMLLLMGAGGAAMWLGNHFHVKLPEINP